MLPSLSLVSYFEKTVIRLVTALFLKFKQRPYKVTDTCIDVYNTMKISKIHNLLSSIVS